MSPLYVNRNKNYSGGIFTIKDKIDAVTKTENRNLVDLFDKKIIIKGYD